jgi:enamine deaminase RidA (YjgF/YER057c/UK114 family)
MCQNAQLMLETAGSSLDKVLKITVSRASMRACIKFKD